MFFKQFTVDDSPGGTEELMKMINGKYGTNAGPDDIANSGKRILPSQRGFDIAADLTSTDDRLPGFHYKEPMQPHNKTFLVTDEDIDSFYNF